MLLLVSAVITIVVLFLLSGSFATAYNYKLKKGGSLGIKWTECWNPKKMFSVLIGFLLGWTIKDYIFEQLVLRVYDPYCREHCLLGNKGKCDHCGCDTWAKMFSPLEEDSRGNWGGMILSRKEYVEHRKKHPVKIKVEYGNVSE